MVPEVLGISHGFHGFKRSQPLKADFVSACGVGMGKEEWEEKVAASCRKDIRFFAR